MTTFCLKKELNALNESTPFLSVPRLPKIDLLKQPAQWLLKPPVKHIQLRLCILILDPLLGDSYQRLPFNFASTDRMLLPLAWTRSGGAPLICSPTNTNAGTQVKWEGCQTRRGY